MSTIATLDAAGRRRLLATYSYVLFGVMRCGPRRRGLGRPLIVS